MAHVYRDVNPNVKLPDEWAAFYRNKQRVIEAWFEDYSVFVRSKNSDKKTENEDYSEIRSVQERLECKSMNWWFDNIQPCSPLKMKCNNKSKLSLEHEKNSFTVFVKLLNPLQ